jgi:hypothetical protein
LSALIGLQELSLANFDQTLEDMVPEDLLSEPADGGAMDVCANVLDAELGSSRAASRALSTLEQPSRMVLALTQPPRVLPEMIRLGWVAQAATQPPRVLPEMIRLGWVVQVVTQPPRVSEWVLPPALPWMFM